jgi:hypothetical protein
MRNAKSGDLDMRPVPRLGGLSFLGAILAAGLLLGGANATEGALVSPGDHDFGEVEPGFRQTIGVDVDGPGEPSANNVRLLFDLTRDATVRGIVQPIAGVPFFLTVFQICEANDDPCIGPAVLARPILQQRLEAGEYYFNISGIDSTGDSRPDFNFAFVVTPIPATAPLLIAALGGLGLLARRRKSDRKTN